MKQFLKQLKCKIFHRNSLKTIGNEMKVKKDEYIVYKCLFCEICGENYINKSEINE